MRDVPCDDLMQCLDKGPIQVPPQLASGLPSQGVSNLDFQRAALLCVLRAGGVEVLCASPRSSRIRGVTRLGAEQRCRRHLGHSREKVYLRRRLGGRSLDLSAAVVGADRVPAPRTAAGP